MCFAGRDAEIDHRTDKPKCHEDIAYASAVKLFTDNWKFCFTDEDCNAATGLGGVAAL
jgi:hypothetical protein